MYCIQYNYISFSMQYAMWHAQYDTITIQYSKKMYHNHIWTASVDATLSQLGTSCYHKMAMVARLR